nr:THUMP domain-containing protein [Pigmentiphaga humi]
MTLNTRPGERATRPSEDSSGADRRVRSGARAHRVARAALETGKQGSAEAPAGERGDAAPSRPRPGDRATPPGRRAPAERSDRPRSREDRPLSSSRRRPDEGGGDAAYRSRRDEAGNAQTGGPRPGRPRERRPAADAAPRQHVIARPGENFAVFAPCPLGLEHALTDELHALGFDDAHPGRAGVHFTADWTGMMRANLHSRLATRILVRVAHGPVQNEDELLELARATPWEHWFGAEQTLRVDTSAVRSPMKSLQFCNLRVKDGICDRLREREGERPSIDTVRPDARVHAFLDETSATLYLDTSGESLFKRGWRLDKGEAPLRENLAAGLLALSGWPGNVPLIDPFCGSGTILIEAALKALGVPPGISRPFAFERLRGHQARHWRDLKDDARARILPELPIQMAGADIDPHAIEAARDNAHRAGLTDEAVYFEVADARDTCPLDDQAGWLITNPPYGERLDLEEDRQLWTEWASTLKREFGGWQLHVITSDFDLPKKLRLDPFRRTPIYNGALDCRLFGFQLVQGQYR